MKHYNQIFPKYFYSRVNETKSIRLINLSSKENRYAYNISCKIIIKNILFYKKKKSSKIKSKINFKNFINQYFNII
jgi:hypothetical protein